MRSPLGPAQSPDVSGCDQAASPSQTETRRGVSPVRGPHSGHGLPSFGRFAERVLPSLPHIATHCHSHYPGTQHHTQPLEASWCLPGPVQAVMASEARFNNKWLFMQISWIMKSTFFVFLPLCVSVCLLSCVCDASWVLCARPGHCSVRVLSLPPPSPAQPGHSHTEQSFLFWAATAELRRAREAVSPSASCGHPAWSPNSDILVTVIISACSPVSSSVPCQFLVTTSWWTLASIGRSLVSGPWSHIRSSSRILSLILSLIPTAASLRSSQLSQYLK